jgi:hypothetical protein
VNEPIGAPAPNIMPEVEEPLKVQVARALRWKEIHLDGGWLGRRPSDDHVYGDLGAAWYAIPDYPNSWSATGPLITRFGIMVGNGAAWATRNPGLVCQQPCRHADPGAAEPNLNAVCKLIIMLGKRGWLT